MGILITATTHTKIRSHIKNPFIWQVFWLPFKPMPRVGHTLKTHSFDGYSDNR
jgi:hypothetical protein